MGYSKRVRSLRGEDPRVFLKQRETKRRKENEHSGEMGEKKTSLRSSEWRKKKKKKRKKGERVERESSR